MSPAVSGPRVQLDLGLAVLEVHRLGVEVALQDQRLLAELLRLLVGVLDLHALDGHRLRRPLGRHRGDELLGRRAGRLVAEAERPALLAALGQGDGQRRWLQAVALEVARQLLAGLRAFQTHQIADQAIDEAALDARGIRLDHARRSVDEGALEDDLVAGRAGMVDFDLGDVLFGRLGLLEAGEHQVGRASFGPKNWLTAKRATITSRAMSRT